MKERLTKPGGRNATYRGERILEIIDKLTDIENKQQACLDVIPPCYQHRLTIGTLNGNSESAKRNNKLFILENAIEAGGLVSTEWHNEQVMQLQEQNELSITIPVKLGTPLYFICTVEEEEGHVFTYNITRSTNWVYVISKEGKITIEDNGFDSMLENSYDYTFNETVFDSEEKAIKAISKLIGGKDANP